MYRGLDVRAARRAVSHQVCQLVQRRSAAARLPVTLYDEVHFCGVWTRGQEYVAHPTGRYHRLACRCAS